jgi:hypothetical protein
VSDGAVTAIVCLSCRAVRSVPAPVTWRSAGACGNCSYVGWAYVGDLEDDYVFGAAVAGDQVRDRYVAAGDHISDLERQLNLIFETAVLSNVAIDIGVPPRVVQALFGVIAELATKALAEVQR